MKISSKLLIIIVSLCVPGLLHSQSDAPEKPKDAHIRILNCCDTSQAERWKTGLDLKFKDQYIGRDIRIAQRGPVGKISFVGKDTIEVFRTGDESRAIARIPASLKAGGFYTIVVLGNLGASASDVEIKLIEEFPISEEELRPDMVRMQLVNAIKNYPAGLTIKSGSANSSPKYSELQKYFFTPGELEMNLVYRHESGKIVSVPWVIETARGEDYVAVIHPSNHRSNTPTIMRINVAAARNQILDLQKNEED
jgi:hypothetical protein